MARTVAYQGGKYRIEYARVNNGTSPGLDFFDGLSKIDQAKLSALFKMAGEGNFHNKEKFGDLGDGLFEFKSFQIRMPYSYRKRDRAVIVVTHGFIKKRDKTPKEEIARAKRILEEDQASSGLVLVKGAKR